MITLKEKEYLRELAKQYRSLAELPENEERKVRMRRVNDLTPDLRPGVWINEIPWHEMNMDEELTLKCQDEFAKGMEWFFKTSLYRWKHIQADTVLPFYYAIHKSFSSTGDGIAVQDDIVKTDDRNHIVSHAYHDQLATQAQLEQVKAPVLTAYPKRDEEALDKAQDVLGGILPVRLMGHQIYYAPWDEISTLRGVEPVLMDMMDRPEFLHRIIQRFSENQASWLDQMEALDLLESELDELHSTPAYTNDLPKRSSDGKTRLRNVWFRSMAQMFNVVSPDMHEEFELQYMRPLMKRCGLVYYGCCEPLDNKIKLLKTIPNMRKIGVSPWAKVEQSAQQLGSSYVFARKPNPAFVAGSFDAQAVREEIKETVEICLKYQCPYEFVLKDISTVSYKPQNLIEWNRVVQETLDEYYG